VEQGDALTQAPGFYDALGGATRALTDGLVAAARRHRIAFSAQAVGGMFGIYFAAQVPDSYEQVMACDRDRFNRFFHAMLDAGIYFAPSAYEAGFVSAAHRPSDIAETVAAAFCLGASGVQVGTRFILAEECTAHEEYKQRVIKAKDIDSKVTGRITGHPVRVLRSPLVREMAKFEYEPGGAEKLEKLGEGSLMRAVLHGDKEGGSFMAGQCACMMDQVQPAADIIRELFDKTSLARIRDDVFGNLLGLKG
jgi:hypothetical protein